MCVFVLVKSVCTALSPALQASFMVQFPVVALELHRDGIIMVNVSVKFSWRAGVVTPSKLLSPYERLSPLPYPLF